MKIAIITIAGMSSRFNQGIDEKVLKAIYTEDRVENTLLYHLLLKCRFADRVVLVGGYKFRDLTEFIAHRLVDDFPEIVVVENRHYEDLSSGYSLYLGIKEALTYSPGEIVFVEGDLDIDDESFAKVAASDKSVLTYNYDLIYANKAVVLYKNELGRYRYSFNSSHGLLSIDEPFSLILNSGQTWKFMDIGALQKANDAFYEEDKSGTNLSIIQKYIDSISAENVEIIGLKRWNNCNTRENYRKIKEHWGKRNENYAGAAGCS